LHPFIGIQLWRVAGQVEEPKSFIGVNDPFLGLFGSVGKMAVDDEEHRAVAFAPESSRRLVASLTGPQEPRRMPAMA
jgi:hypothetical protein